jgi:hypothetical protein
VPRKCIRVSTVDVQGIERLCNLSLVSGILKAASRQGWAQQETFLLPLVFDSSFVLKPFKTVFTDRPRVFRIGEYCKG